MSDRDFSMFGARLRAARESKGLTQQEVADAVGVRVQQIWRYENAGALPRTDRLVQLADALGIGIAMLANGERRCCNKEGR